MPCEFRFQGCRCIDCRGDAHAAPTTAARLDAIEPERANLARTYVALRWIVERTLWLDPQSSAAPEARAVLDGLAALVDRARALEQATADAAAKVTGR